MPPTDSEKATHEKLEKDVKDTLSEYKVNCKIWAALHHFTRFHSLEEFAERSANKTDALQQGRDALGFASNVEGWDASASLLNAVRLDNAVEEAQARVKQRSEIRRDTSGHIPAKIIVETMDRQNMERAHAACNNGVRPPLEDQLNDACLGTQLK